MESLEEKSLINYPSPIYIEQTAKLLKQMKKSVAKICNTDGSKGTGFFCKIKLSEQSYIPVFLSNYHVIKEGIEIEIKMNDGKFSKKINLKDKFKYANPEYDVFIIEMKENEDQSGIEYLELDKNVIKGNNLDFIGKSVYILQYPRINEEGKVAVSYGIIKSRYEDKKYIFKHFCSTEDGSSGSPIFNLTNNQVIGIHKGAGNKEYNIGVFLSEPINEFINKFKKKNIINEIKMEKLGIEEKNLFYNLYKKRLIKNFVEIKDNGMNIAFKFLLNKKPNITTNQDKWITAWHGTLYEYLESIIKYGLKCPGTQLEDGTYTPEIRNIPYETKFDVYRNWEEGIFASPSLYIAKEYSANLFRCVLEVKINLKNKDKVKKYRPADENWICGTSEDYFFHETPEYRISS